MISVIGLLFLLLCLLCAPVFASHHYTEKQLDAFSTRVGKMFWVIPVDGQLPLFLLAPSSNAQTFLPSANQSFEILELIGRKSKTPYYKVKFDSEKEGYIQVENFHEQFNATILTVDPVADEKKRLAEQNEQEMQRVAWIRAQPWSQAVKEAAIKRQVATGMNSGEVKKVLGNPIRVQRVRMPHQVTEEHWFYADGRVLIFQNRLLNRIELRRKEMP